MSRNSASLQHHVSACWLSVHFVCADSNTALEMTPRVVRVVVQKTLLRGHYRQLSTPFGTLFKISSLFPNTLINRSTVTILNLLSFALINSLFSYIYSLPLISISINTFMFKVSVSKIIKAL